MNKEDLTFKIKNEKINNEMTKIELNLRLNGIRVLTLQMTSSIIHLYHSSIVVFTTKGTKVIFA